ncbi:MAG: hypothetical protein JKY51_12075 [Opitutaceae bacterium]|nr:hypothetical protein [Opitutaceae bacterium]
MISVTKTSAGHFEVIVSGQPSTTHQVTLSEEYYDLLTKRTISHESLLEKSFEFLLERESHTSILQSFDLSIINTYFPEYEKIILSST